MKLTLLGTGGPRPDPRRHGAAAVLQVGDQYLLFDTGRGVVLQLVAAGIPLERVAPIFLTHHHYDHIGDLADVILTSWLQGRQHALPVIGPPGTRAIVTALLEQVYDRDIMFRSTGALAIYWPSVATTDAQRGLVYDGGYWRVYAEEVVHGHGLDFPHSFTQRWVCLGYRVESEGKSVTISGDCVACEGLTHLAQESDVLVQCCFLAKSEITTPALVRLSKDTIACADTVGKIATEAGVKRLILTHFRRESDSVMQALAAEVAHDYAGPVILGEDLLELLL